MASKLSYSSDIARKGDNSTISADEFDGSVSLSEGEAISVWSKQVPADKAYAWGFGTRNREDARSSFMHAALEASGAGSGTDGDAVTGALEVEITDSEQRDTLFRYNYGSLGNLADAASDNRTERPMQPALGPGAREDRHIEIKIVADSNSDGVELDPADCDARLWYTEVDR